MPDYIPAKQLIFFIPGKSGTVLSLPEKQNINIEQVSSLLNHSKQTFLFWFNQANA